jgi:hypothetical protein
MNKLDEADLQMWSQVMLPSLAFIAGYVASKRRSYGHQTVGFRYEILSCAVNELHHQYFNASVRVLQASSCTLHAYL